MREMTERFWSVVLLDDVYFLALALAALVFLAIQYLTRASWWVGLRRVPEAMGGFVPIAAVLSLLLYFGRTALYPWSRPGAASDPAIAAKGAYLSTPFFFLRLLLVLAVWTLFARRFRALARRRDEAEEGSGGPSRAGLVRLSAAFVPVFAVTFAVASFDWLMSLDPTWYSTIFAVYCFAGLFLGGLAAITLFVVVLRERGGLAGRIEERHLHDLGKLLFAFSTFWAYIWVSQYLLIWYSDIPEEVTFYVARTTGAWAPWFFAAFALNFAVPFLVLLARAPKRSPRVLAGVAILVLVGRWIDLYVLIGPPVLGTPKLGALEVLLTLAYAALFAGFCLRRFGAGPGLAPAAE